MILMAPAKTTETSTGFAIWQDIKILLVSCFLFSFCLTPLGLVLMWSWGIWTPKVRKVVTWLAILALIFFVAVCGRHWRGHHGGRWGRGCPVGGWSQGGENCGKGEGKVHCRENGEDEDEEAEAEEKSEEPVKSEGK